MRRARDQRDRFPAGELQPNYLNRFDDIAKQGLKRGRNIVILNSGVAARRPGSEQLAAQAALRVVTLDGILAETHDLYFYNERVEIREMDGTLVQNVTSAPWVTADIETMQIVEVEDNLVIVSESFFPQVLAYDGSTWSLGDMTFFSGIGGEVRQPYYRYAPRGVTITPSARTGSITVTASASVFTSAHVGTRIRYLGKQILITAYTSGTQVTGTVTGTLYPTYSVTVGSTSGFSVGQLVEGEDSQVRGVVASIASGTVMTVLMTEGYDNFDVTGTENIIGPESKSAVSASSVTTSAASLQWDEQMISPVYGFPEGCSYHRSRLLLFGFDSAPNQLAAFVPGVFNDFFVDAGADNEAFIYGIGDNEKAKILHCVPGEQLIVLTNKGHYYVAERAESPFTPTGMLRGGFAKIGPEASTTCRPAALKEGVLFVTASDETAGTGPRIMLIEPTGNVLRAWVSKDISEFAPHLINDPREVVVQLGITTQPERLILVRNADATIACSTFRPQQTQQGWVLWSFEGGVHSLSGVRRRLVLAYGSVSNREIVKMDFAKTCDAMSSYSAAATARAGEELSLVWNGEVVATDTLDGSGNFPDIDPDSEYELGIDFSVEVTPVPFIHPQDPSPKPRRGVRAYATVEDAGRFRMNGVSKGNFAASIDLGAAPVQSSRTEEEFMGGLIFRPEMAITIPAGEGCPFQLADLTIEAAD